jgi:5-methylcytosine-specific restriction endonuclease McrA
MFFRRGKNGVTKIRRDTYNNKATTGKTWWDWCKEVRARARNCCEVPTCRAAEDPKRGIYHEVHHIKPLSKGGVTALWNLILLCKRCHDQRHNHLFRARRN